MSNLDKASFMWNMYNPQPGALQTWVELQMVNSHANTLVLRSMVRTPNTQVSPSKGRRMTVAFSVDLIIGSININLNINVSWHIITLILYSDVTYFVKSVNVLELNTILIKISQEHG